MNIFDFQQHLKIYFKFKQFINSKNIYLVKLLSSFKLTQVKKNFVKLLKDSTKIKTLRTLLIFEINQKLASRK